MIDGVREMLSLEARSDSPSLGKARKPGRLGCQRLFQQLPYLLSSDQYNVNIQPKY